MEMPAGVFSHYRSVRTPDVLLTVGLDQNRSYSVLFSILLNLLLLLCFIDRDGMSLTSSVSTPNFHQAQRLLYLRSRNVIHASFRA
jgi:hypothetical protein